MKELKNLFILTLIIVFVVFVLISLLVDSLFSRQFYVADTLVAGIAFAFILAGVYVWRVYSLLKPKLNFLCSEETPVPAFGDKIEKVIPVDNSNFSFEVIMYRIKEEYEIVTYDDVEHYVLKFRTKILSPTTAVVGVVVYDAVAGMATLSCYPLSAHTEKSAKNVHNMFDKVEKLIY